MSRQIKLNMLSQTPQNKDFQGEMHWTSQTFYEEQCIFHVPLMSCFCYFVFILMSFLEDTEFQILSNLKRHKNLNFLNLKRKSKGPQE